MVKDSLTYIRSDGNMIQIEKCHLCGFVTNRHLIHSGDGKIYCVPHYLLHVLNDEIEPPHKQNITNHG